MHILPIFRRSAVVLSAAAWLAFANGCVCDNAVRNPHPRPEAPADGKEVKNLPPNPHPRPDHHKRRYHPHSVGNPMPRPSGQSASPAPSPTASPAPSPSPSPSPAS